ncbi:MAG: adenylyltransferase/cytidyltransferase family protein [Lachnospiraceae bacterium]|jgi:glycerol-3-phosphate cytidylyltransferase|nr:adenylyltransferase/cytidyltransferase family protein [Lachnospiraceae bacterium]
MYEVGYTSGTYDLFHIGHLNLLKKAKEYCRHLIVGVSTDELIRSYKFMDPITPFNERLEIIKAIRYVDEAVPQHELDKIPAFEKYHYNVLIIGDDWKGTTSWDGYEKEKKRLGFEIIYLPYTKSISSTLIKEKIKNMEEDFIT